MRKLGKLPYFLAGISMVLICAIVWQTMPRAEAQEERTQPTPPVSTEPARAKNDKRSLVRLNSGEIDVRSEQAVAERQAAVADFAGKRLHLVKFNGPIRRDWYEGLEKSGLEIVNYIPDYAYLVYGDAAEIQKQQSVARTAGSPVEWDGEYKGSHRIQPGVYLKENENTEEPARLAATSFLVQLYKDTPTNDATLGFARNAARAAIRNQWEIGKYVNFVVDLDEAGVQALSERPDVISIAPWIEPEKNDERQNIIMTGNIAGGTPNPGDYLAYLASKGFAQDQFDASNFVVNISDDGLDAGAGPSPSFEPLPPLTQFVFLKGGDFAGGSRIAYNRPYGTATQFHTQGCDGHGNLNASIVAGYVPGGAPYNAAPHADASGYRFGLGVAPFVKIGSSTIFSHTAFTNPNIPVMEAEAYASGSRISTNSWGANTGGGYNANSQTYDILVRDARPSDAGNQEYVILFAAGNGGSGLNTVGAPGTGKNVITVGASENVHPFPTADGCNIANSGADSGNDIIAFSGRGPTDDGRIKPEIVAPGTHVSGTVFQSAALTGTPVSGTGLAASCWDASGVCGVGSTASIANSFFPGQQFYSASSGTSHSTPAVAGFAALIRQHFINQGRTPPSPAMTKALLMNTSRYMTGVGANDDLWSNSQGMGMTSMNNYFDGLFGGTNMLNDQAQIFTESGQSRTISATVADNSKPVRITLTWTDKEGSTTAGTLVNNLDLEVIANGQVYHGNRFDGEYSIGGATADSVNNAESVFLPPGVTGPLAVRVRAKNIAGDGVRGNGQPLDQDYALVVQNLNESNATFPLIITEGVTYFSDYGNNNGVPEPGETVVVSLGLRNAGTAPGTVSATLQASGGITNPLPPTHSYGTVAPDGPIVTKNFSFVIPGDTPCNSTITTTFTIDDGGAGTTITQDFLVGEEFDIGPFAIPSSGAASPYPGTLLISGLTEPISDVKVELTGLTHTFPGDLDFVLVSPTGEAFSFLSDIGAGNDVNNVNLVFDDAAGAVPPTTIVSGTYKPSNSGAGDNFPAPGPGTAHEAAQPGGSATFASTFDGKDGNGVWRLFIVDDAAGDTGTLAQWKLTVNGVSAITSICNPPLPDLSISGRVIFPKPGGHQKVTLVLTDLADGTTRQLPPDAFGYFAFAPLRPAKYTLTPVSNDFTFTPTGYNFNLISSQGDINFTARKKGRR